MEFFDKIGKKASEAYKITADKTGKIAKETKNRLKIGELKTQINEIYGEIGKKVYEKHTREEDIDIKQDLEEQCIKIDALSDEIDELLKECLTLKNKKQCPKCYKEIEKEDKFCPNCGKKQEEIKIQVESEKEEVAEKTENEVEETKEENKQENEEEVKNKQDEDKENIEEKIELEKNENEEITTDEKEETEQ